MKPTLLKATLYVIGGMCSLGGLALVLPEIWLRVLAGWLLGAEAVNAYWPSAPLFTYVLRTSFVAYLWIGVILLVAARNPGAHRTQIDIAMGGLLLMAVVMLVNGLLLGIPPLWFLGDSITTFVGAVLLFVLRPARTG